MSQRASSWVSPRIVIAPSQRRRKPAGGGGAYSLTLRTRNGKQFGTPVLRSRSQKPASWPAASSSAASNCKIGRAHVRTPVTNANLVCRLPLERKKKYNIDSKEKEKQ